MDIRNGEVISNVTTNLIEDAIKFAWDKVKGFFKDIDDQDAIRYRTAYEKYINNTRKKNSKIKTIIYRRVPKDLYSFYECIGVRYNGQTINTEKISNLFPIGNKIIVTGTGGVGKSMLFKHFFLNTIDETPFIPVMLELRSFNIMESKEVSLYEGIYKVLCDNGFELSKDNFEYSMKEGAYVILFDGYDEVNRDKTEKITSEIKSLSEKYNDNKFFLSSRPTHEFIGWNDFCEVEAMKLSKTQALSLIKKIDYDDETAKELFYKALDDTLYDKYESFASNPLLLTIMLLTFQKHAKIPERLNDFYEEAFVTLFNAHDATKDSYVRDIRCGLGCEDFKYIFSYLCFKSYFNGEFEFSEARLLRYLSQAKEKIGRVSFDENDFVEDLTQSVCMLVKEGLVYRFSHRSFQEYFAAWYTCKLLDETQGKLLLSWIKESDSVTSDSYFKMLHGLQSNKVNKIVLCPIFKDLKVLYERNGFSVTFLKELFSDMIIRRKVIDEEEKFDVSLTIKNFYLCRGLLLNNELNGYARNESLNQVDKIIYQKLNEYLKQIKKPLSPSRYKISFDTAEKIFSQEEILNSVDWFKGWIDSALQLLDSYEESNISRKKKVASILDEL